MLKALNVTFINVYNIIAKVIANRLKQFLYQIISKEQGKFVGSKQILGEVIVAQETIYSLKS